MKQKRKRVLSILTAAALAVGCAAGCSGGQEEQKKESVKLIVATPPLFYGKMGGGDAQTAAYTDFLEYAAEKFSEQYKKADVEIKVVGFDYLDEKKAVTDQFDTSEAVDVLFEGFFNMSSYIHTGRLAPLDDIIDSGEREDIAENMWKEGVYQEKTYMYPFYHLPNTLVYNADLFRQAGLERYIAPAEEITNWSLEDWNTILDTLAGNLPESSFPMMMYGKNNQGDTHTMVLLRAFGCPFFGENEDIRVNTPEGIEALQWIQSGVDRGWFPPGSENMEISDCIQLFNNGQLAVSITNPSNQPFFKEAGIDARLVNFPSTDGKGLSTTFVTGFGAFDNGNKMKLQAAKDFIQFICRDEELSQAVIPNIPARSSMQELYGEKIPNEDSYAANESTLVNFTGNLPNWAGVREAFYPNIHDLLNKKFTPEQAASGIDEACNRAIKDTD